jgi:PAS domain S-box-containing protein
MVIVSPEGRFLAANGTFCDCLGYTEEELLQKTVQSVTFPEDWPPFSQQLSDALAGGQGLRRVEKRCLHRSGSIVHTESSASLVRSRDGVPQYLVGDVLDVTKRKEAEEALSGMTRKLVEAQEQERTRIGRELHDDITQRLVMLAIEIEQAREHPLGTSLGAQGQAHQLSGKVKEIATDIQVLSHQLHSSKLEYLGLVGGMRSWCKEFGERQKMEIAFKSAGLQAPPPPEISLCLFRVLQEALNNAARHSGAKQMDVQLWEESGEIQLIVRDSGKGFDLTAAMQDRGLGVTSMHERVRLVGGTIVVDSKLMAGTTIHVRVPFSAKTRSQMTAG